MKDQTAIICLSSSEAQPYDKARVLCVCSAGSLPLLSAVGEREHLPKLNEQNLQTLASLCFSLSSGTSKVH